ncbi:hypothetical protein NLI96_g13128 [Meripilus lineatus]|uniref:Uncharacterized protein n=1 Tax=Meripilus lineatus TaxID=2056292 RepID=A0AAD5UQE4_9APHY|nr:hypothetical protein NLI96_g13128 [Physisporinus lineatus]
MPQSAPLDNIEWWKLGVQAGAYAITWVIVFVGWRVNSAQNDRRDARKEVREYVDATAALIREAESHGMSFLSKDEADLSLYWATYFAVQRIDISTLPLPNISDITRQLVLFRKLMTNKVTIGPDSPLPPAADRRSLMFEVSRGANKFIAVLEDGYRKRYPLR